MGRMVELERQDNEVVTVRVARNSLKLLYLLVEGLDMRELIRSGESIDATAPPLTHPDTIPDTLQSSKCP
jgi:hypothetical protein